MANYNDKKYKFAAENLTALNATQLTSGTIPAARIATASIANDLIDSAHLAAAGIDNEHLADDAVDSAELAAGAVDTAHIAADNIVASLIADNAIDSEHYTDGSIDNAHIADDAIDSEHYADGSIDNAHIADDQIDSEHYAAGSIDLEHMSSESVDEDNLKISNAGSNGEFLSKQSGNTGGLTWAAAGSSTDHLDVGTYHLFYLNETGDHTAGSTTSGGVLGYYTGGADYALRTSVENWNTMSTVSGTWRHMSNYNARKSGGASPIRPTGLWCRTA